MSATFQLKKYSWALFLSFVGVASAISAEAQTRDWIFSGAELIEALQGKSTDAVPVGELGRVLSTVRASAYIAGVADASNGTRWCGGGKVLPHELVDRVFTYHRTVEPERLKGNASILVMEALAVSFPCDGK